MGQDFLDIKHDNWGIMERNYTSMHVIFVFGNDRIIIIIIVVIKIHILTPKANLLVAG